MTSSAEDCPLRYMLRARGAQLLLQPGDLRGRLVDARLGVGNGLLGGRFVLVERLVVAAHRDHGPAAPASPLMRARTASASAELVGGGGLGERQSRLSKARPRPGRPRQIKNVRRSRPRVKSAHSSKPPSRSAAYASCLTLMLVYNDDSVTACECNAFQQLQRDRVTATTRSPRAERSRRCIHDFGVIVAEQGRCLGRCAYPAARPRRPAQAAPCPGAAPAPPPS